ncbi:MAG: SMI1/KNR4 family protein [Capnocytophaga sp.]|nr:SMI1/KNR4 family protein [Capnocytophaga sp.]
MTEQLSRIQQKIAQAKASDKDFEVFGAEGHQYHLNPPASEAEILAFEQKYAISLPECYRSFMRTIGDSTAQKQDNIAGPYYGLYAFGTQTDEFVYEGAEEYLKAPCLLSPTMTDAQWEALTDKLLSEEGDFDEEENTIEVEDDYFAERGKVFGGLLPLGSQGCTYFHALVLNGDYAGRVVNVDIDLRCPKFAFEANFLDWYERYLDEVISGQLIDDRPTWFGYYRGEAPEALLYEYTQTTDRDTQTDCLEGVYHKKAPLPEAVLNQIESLIALNNEDKIFLIEILAQSSYERARPYLQSLVNEKPKEVFQYVYWYAKDHYAEWVPIVKELLPTITDESTLDFATYLLTESESEGWETFILPFTDNENPNIRITAYYTLGQSEKRELFLDTFIKGLQETDNNVLRTAMQALRGITDERLLPYYKQIAKRFPKEKDYILSNLQYLLEPFGLTVKQARK